MKQQHINWHTKYNIYTNYRLSNPSTFPLIDIIQDHFRESFEALIKIVGRQCLVVNNECCQLPTLIRAPPMLTSAVTGCKLSKLGWNKIGSKNIFPNIFIHIRIYHMYSSIYKSIWKHNFFAVSWQNGSISLWGPLSCVMLVLCLFGTWGPFY